MFNLEKQCSTSLHTLVLIRKNAVTEVAKVHKNKKLKTKKDLQQWLQIKSKYM